MEVLSLDGKLHFSVNLLEFSVINQRYWAQVNLVLANMWGTMWLLRGHVALLQVWLRPAVSASLDESMHRVCAVCISAYLKRLLILERSNILGNMACHCRDTYANENVERTTVCSLPTLCIEGWMELMYITFSLFYSLSSWFRKFCIRFIEKYSCVSTTSFTIYYYTHWKTLSLHLDTTTQQQTKIISASFLPCIPIVYNLIQTKFETYMHIQAKWDT